MLLKYCRRDSATPRVRFTFTHATLLFTTCVCEVADLRVLLYHLKVRMFRATIDYGGAVFYLQFGPYEFLALLTIKVKQEI